MVLPVQRTALLPVKDLPPLITNYCGMKLCPIFFLTHLLIRAIRLPAQYSVDPLFFGVAT